MVGTLVLAALMQTRPYHSDAGNEVLAVQDRFFAHKLEADIEKLLIDNGDEIYLEVFYDLERFNSRRQEPGVAVAPNFGENMRSGEVSRKAKFHMQELWRRIAPKHTEFLMAGGDLPFGFKGQAGEEYRWEVIVSPGPAPRKIIAVSICDLRR